MWTKLTIIGCLLLTAVVVHTALRIERINALCHQYLPRAHQAAGTTWEIPQLQHVLNYVEDKIAIRRSNSYSVEHPDEQLPPEDKFFGAPYSASEQKWIDDSVADHAMYSKLHWWVTRFGSVQYVLAPLAFVWAIGNFLSIRKTKLRVVSTLCAALAFGAIFLMIFRGY
jgi:hypothetical protein